MRKLEGIVTGLIAGFYDVQTREGLIRTRARGVFRRQKQKPAVGDQVKIQVDDQGTSYLVELLPRFNQIGRPAVANVDHVLLVISAVEPDFSLQLLDRYLTFFAWKCVDVSIYLAKSDLVPADKLSSIKNELAYYQQMYQVWLDRSKLKQDLPLAIAKGQIWTLAGQSGAGKSTLINYLKDGLAQKTAAISTSLNRGKHTTRTVQLFQLGQGFLADTPGFSAIDLTPIRLDELCNYFIEFKTASGKCKFRHCQHLHEPKCEVKQLVESGQIKKERYENYLALRTEINRGKLPEYLK